MSMSILPQITRTYLEDLRQRWDVQGISIALVASPSFSGNDGAAEWQEQIMSLGIANGKGDPVKADSLFTIASNSKCFLALAVSTLIARKTPLPGGGTLEWSTKIKDIIPEWKLMDGYASDHVDILDLLTMRTGLPRHDHSYRSTDTAEEITARLRHLRPSTEIRRDFQYNNIHYVVLTRLFPCLLGISYADWVQQNIFDPLGMINTTFSTGKARDTGQMVDGFLRTGRDLAKGKEGWKGVMGMDREVVLGKVESMGWWTEEEAVYAEGAGGIISTPNDMAKWLRELLDPKIIPSEAITAIHRSHTIPFGTTPKYPEIAIETYCLGLCRCNYRGVEIIYHDGGLPGQPSRIMRVPSRGIGFAIFTNDDAFGGPMSHVIGYRLLDTLLGFEPIDWEERLMGDCITSIKEYDPIREAGRPPSDGFDLVAGEYEHPGYGVIKLERVDPEHPDGTLSTILDCLTLRMPLKLRAPVFLVKFDNRPWASHILFTHLDGSKFAWNAVRLYRRGGLDGNGHVLWSSGDGQAMISKKGIGMFGDWWGKGPSVAGSVISDDEDDIQAKAEVWFGRVHSL